MYVTQKERDNLLAACDFISTNADGAIDYEPFEEMKQSLMSMFHKATKDIQNRHKKKLVKKYLKQIRGINQ